MIQDLLKSAAWPAEDVDLYLMHQATAFMLEHLRTKLQLPLEKLPIDMEEVGNTVSSTLPILIEGLRRKGRLKPGVRTLLVGFGVGLSWAGCAWTERHRPCQGRC